MRWERLGPAWVLWLELDELPQEAEWLSEAERELAGRYGHPRRLRQFLAGRWAVRRLWREVAELEEPVEVIPDPQGRPLLYVSGEALMDWAVSIAHSGSRVLVALRQGGRLGVDVEGQRPRSGALVSRLLDAEEWELMQRWAPEEPILAAWVLKEAGFKALGSGLRAPLRNLRLVEEGGRLLLQGVDARLQAHLMRMDPAFWAAVAWD
jgi:4'-phosphopantetheinyl transferase